jgi:hypothetical protein
VIKFFLFLFFPIYVVAATFYAKAEPYERYTVKSNVMGEVLMVNENAEGKVASREKLIVIDSVLDHKELTAVRNKRNAVKSMIAYNETLLANYEAMVERKTDYLEAIEALKTKSKLQKDREFYDTMNTKNLLLSTKEKIENLKIQANDLAYRQAVLQKSINDKTVRKKGLFIQQFLVREFDVVNVGTPLMEVANVAKARLAFHINADELKELEKPVIYLDDQKTGYKVDKVWKLTGRENFLSAYRAEIIIDAPEQFSKLIKIEFKGE